MNANQARLIAYANNEASRKEMMATVFACINTAAKRGEFETTYNAATSEELVVIADQLLKLGYTVQRCASTAKPIKVNQLTSIKISWDNS